MSLFTQVDSWIEKVQTCLNEKGELEAYFPSNENVSWEALASIRAHLVQKAVKKSSGIHRSRLNEYARRYQQGESVLSIARAINFPPYLLLKHVVPLILPEVARARKPLKEAAAIGDERLRKELLLCEEEDMDYSPSMDRIRQTAGLEFEYKLQRELIGRGILFDHEDDLREQGFHKTPDVLLSVPLALIIEKLKTEEQRESKSQKIQVIRWIDSKAMFGDYFTHANDNKEQFQSYINRFGQGMVIYWSGFDPRISTIFPDVVVVDCFPADALVNI